MPLVCSHEQVLHRCFVVCSCVLSDLWMEFNIKFSCTGSGDLFYSLSARTRLCDIDFARNGLGKIRGRP